MTLHKAMHTDTIAPSLFHPLVARWFDSRFERPTDAQRHAWPRIAAGEHLLLTAPTGSGKTLTAFLWALDRLIRGEWATGRTSVLYVSPLKALNNDIQRNLIGPLEELRALFEREGEPFPDIRVLTRSGDTPQSTRRRMQRHPPEILITTPESLNLLLSSAGGRSILTALTTVILDEIHALVGNKRGTHLITAVDRLVGLSGEFQRIALSATIRPLEAVAEFVGGYVAHGVPPDVRYTPRPVSIVRSATQKRYDVQVRFPAAVAEGIADSFWEPFAEAFREIIAANRSTLLFTNARRLCERLTLLINEGEERPLAYAHHGSLSRELREEVERQLKAGDLRAIVATSSLEMGIDIGALDEVVLIQSPPTISSAIQRIGRAGHQVGQVSRGTLFPTHSRDLIAAATLARATLEGDIETIRPVSCPLDVLAQTIVSMVGTETWDIDALYAQLRTSAPYHLLRRDVFDQVLEMLAGRYEETRIRELRARVSIDRTDNTVRARKGALLAVYMSGGVIPDRGYYHLRHHETNARIGELDEEFVWEADVGATFTLGTQKWRIERITHNDVFVAPARHTSPDAPFWKAEQINRDFHFSDRIGRFLETANEQLEDDRFAVMLRESYRMDEASAAQLIGFLRAQKQATGCDLPHRHHLLIEHVNAAPGGAAGSQVVLHTGWGARVNRPFGMALAAAWEAHVGQRVEVYVENDSVALLSPDDIGAEELLALVRPDEVEELLRKQLEGSGFFGARFRECAGRALLLTRGSMNRRMPLWLMRKKSQVLLHAVLGYEDFPILLETWRTCLQDEFDLESLRRVLAEIDSGEIVTTEVRLSHASPFARTASWGQINEYMYADDRPDSASVSKLRGDLLHDVVFTPGLRPRVSEALVAQFERKRQRLIPGYAPQTGLELLDWATERLAIPHEEWEALLAAIRSDHGIALDELLGPVESKLARVRVPGATGDLIVPVEMASRLLAALCGGLEGVEIATVTGGMRPPLDPAEIEARTEDREELLATVLSEWLRFYGPVPITAIEQALGVPESRLRPALDELADDEKVVIGALVEGIAEERVCDGENFEMLLRMARAEAIPAFEPLGIESLPTLLATIQGLTQRGSGIDALFRTIEQLFCYPARAERWEAEILPARLDPYEGTLLDALMQEGHLRWVGVDRGQIAFCFAPDLALIQTEPSQQDGNETENSAPSPERESLADLFPDAAARYDFTALLQNTGMSPGALAERLWEAVWSGHVTNDTFLALRRGIEARFAAPAVADRTVSAGRQPRRMGGRTAFTKWRGSLPYAGSWMRLPSPEPIEDLIELEERRKDRVRLLLDRYGVLFRELLQHELPAFRWPAVFRSLRLMELSGEVLAGCFFHGIPGLQFISHQAFRLLQRGLPEEVVYWMNATDPASVCGLPLTGLPAELPKRLVSAHVVYRGSRLVMVSERNGKELTFHVPPDDPRLPEYLAPIEHLLTRAFQPLPRITVEAINGEDPERSPYLDALRDVFDVTADYKSATLYRKIGSFTS